MRAVAGEGAGALVDFDVGAAIDRSIDWVQQPRQSIVTLGDAEYPASLFEIPDPPNVLYLRGNPAIIEHRGLAIVGSRNATPQGMQTTEAFARVLAGKGLAIVSGLPVDRLLGTLTLRPAMRIAAIPGSRYQRPG